MSVHWRIKRLLKFMLEGSIHGQLLVHILFIKDESQPVLQNYRPPSPIKLNIDEPTMIRQNESYSRQEKNSFSANSVD